MSIEDSRPLGMPVNNWNIAAFPVTDLVSIESSSNQAGVAAAFLCEHDQNNLLYATNMNNLLDTDCVRW